MRNTARQNNLRPRSYPQHIHGFSLWSLPSLISGDLPNELEGAIDFIPAPAGTVELDRSQRPSNL
jgi:hypothetical protein